MKSVTAQQPAGQVLIFAAVLLALTVGLAVAVVTLVLGTSRASGRVARTRLLTEASAAGIERALFCLAQSDANTCGGSPGAAYAGESNLSVGAATVTTTLTTLDELTRTITSAATLADATIRIQVTAKLRRDEISFLYATQIGDGGLSMSNNSEINGALYSNGSIAGAAGAKIIGDVSTNATMDKVKVTGIVRADSIKNSTITGDAYYQTIQGTTVSGNEFPGTPPPDPLPLPISDETIEAWRDDARAGTTIVGDYHPDAGSSVSLGPAEITGNLTLDNNQTLTQTGTIYVRGTITISNNADIRLDPAYGSNSGIFVADGWIHLENNGTFSGAGAGSFLMFFSTAAGGGHHDSAIDLHNNALGTIFYASRGLINVHNNADVSELAGYRVTLGNNAVLNYEEALADAVFTSGPNGRWALLKGTWREIP